MSLWSEKVSELVSWSTGCSLPMSICHLLPSLMTLQFSNGWQERSRTMIATCEQLRDATIHYLLQQ